MVDEIVDNAGKVLKTSVEQLEYMGLLVPFEDGTPVAGSEELSEKGEQLRQGDEVLKKAWADKNFDLFLSRTKELMD